LARPKGRMNARITAFGPVVVVIVGDDVSKRANLGVFKFGQVGRDVVVEVNFNIGVLGFVRVASGGAVNPDQKVCLVSVVQGVSGCHRNQPIPTIRAHDCLIIRQFSSIDNGRACLFHQIHKIKQNILLLWICKCPERLPGYAERSSLEHRRVGYVLNIATRRCFPNLNRGIVVTGIDTMNSIQGIDRIFQRSAKCANRVLVDAPGDDAGARSQADRGFNGNNGISLSGIDQTAISFRPQCKRNDVVRYCNCGSRTASTRVDCEIIRTPRLSFLWLNNPRSNCCFAYLPIRSRSLSPLAPHQLCEAERQ